MRAFLIGASAAQNLEHTQGVLAELKANPATDVFVAVDGGLMTWLSCGLKPHLAVGDWDSFSGQGTQKILKALHHLTLPRAKDRSDFHHALAAVIRAGATEVHCLGVTGGRPDHHLASLFELSTLTQSSLRQISAYGLEAEYHFRSAQMDPWVARFLKTRTLSVFAMGDTVRGVNLKGLEYPLKNATLEPGSHGLSNRTLPGKKCEVSFAPGAKRPGRHGQKSGLLVVLLPA